MAHGHVANGCSPYQSRMPTGTTPRASSESWSENPTVTTRSGWLGIVVSPYLCSIVTGNADDAGSRDTGRRRRPRRSVAVGAACRLGGRGGARSVPTGSSPPSRPPARRWCPPASSSPSRRPRPRAARPAPPTAVRRPSSGLLSSVPRIRTSCIVCPVGMHSDNYDVASGPRNARPRSVLAAGDREVLALELARVEEAAGVGGGGQGAGALGLVVDEPLVAVVVADADGASAARSRRTPPRRCDTAP